MAIVENEDTKRLKLFCSERVPVLVNPYLYKTLKLTFPWDIGGLGIGEKTEMGHRSIVKAVSILTPTMFKADIQHKKI